MAQAVRVSLSDASMQGQAEFWALPLLVLHGSVEMAGQSYITLTLHMNEVFYYRGETSASGGISETFSSNENEETEADMDRTEVLAGV